MPSKAKKLEVLFEFLVFGIVIGIIEDLIAVKVATGENITLETVGIVVLIAIPFAFLGEIVADNIDFAEYFKRFAARRAVRKRGT